VAEMIWLDIWKEYITTAMRMPEVREPMVSITNREAW